MPDIRNAHPTGLGAALLADAERPGAWRDRTLCVQAAVRMADLEATVAHVWKLSLAAQAEIEDGDLSEINGRLDEIAEDAAEALGKDEL